MHAKPNTVAVECKGGKRTVHCNANVFIFQNSNGALLLLLPTLVRCLPAIMHHFCRPDFFSMDSKKIAFRAKNIKPETDAAN